MGRGRGRGREPESTFAGRRDATTFDPTKEPATPAAPAPEEAPLAAYLRQTERLRELRNEVVVATPQLLRTAFDECFAAHEDLVGIGWTDEPSPYYDENCSVQIGDRWAGGGLVVRDGEDGATLDMNGYRTVAAHPAGPVVKDVLRSIPAEVVDEIFGSDGVAVCYTRTGRIVWDFEGDVREGEGDPDFGTINAIVNDR